MSKINKQIQTLYYITTVDFLFWRRTFLTNSFKNIVNAMQSKSFRQINHRDMCTFQAECTMTFLTIKMRM